MRLLRQHHQVGVPARVVAVNRHARAAFRFQVRQLLAVAVHFAQARGDDRALKPDYPPHDADQQGEAEEYPRHRRGNGGSDHASQPAVLLADSVADALRA